MSRRRQPKLVVSSDEDSFEDSSECCAQYSLLAINLPLILFGVAFIVLGAWTLANRTFAGALQVASGAGGLLEAVIAFFVIMGVVVIIFSIVGCVAALVESKRAVLCYYGCVLALFLLIVITLVIGIIYRSQVAEKLRSDLIASVPLYDPNSPDAVETKAWDTMQHDLQCCGVSEIVNGSSAATTLPLYIWRQNDNLNSGSADSKVPESCCRIQNGEQTDCNDKVEGAGNTVQPQLAYSTDCFDAAAAILTEWAADLAIVALAFGLIVILAACLAICYYYLVD